MRIYERITGARGAALSDCGQYRYALWRCWDELLPPLVVIMCNPSTANATDDDPTIRKLIGFGKRLGYGGIAVGNLWAFRSGDPDRLSVADDPVGPDNNTALRDLIAMGGALRGVLAAWGAVARDKGPHYEDQVAHLQSEAAGLDVDLLVLKLADDQLTPRHPLMLAYSCTLSPWRWPGGDCRDCA